MIFIQLVQFGIFLLCGRAPSGSDMREYLEKSNSQITPTDIDIIMKCLSSSIENRYSSLRRIIADSKECCYGMGGGYYGFSRKKWFCEREDCSGR